jgi:hypothetical protein
VPPTFQRAFAGVKTLDHGTGPAITFTRETGATYFDADGVLQSAAEDAPRFDHDPVTGESRGLLIEEARTNSLRNSQGGGSTVGTHTGGSGAGGVLPTNWIWTAGGLDLDVVGTGTESGFSYIEIRFYGTTNSTSAALGYEAQSHIVAADGQTWTASHYVRTVAGDLTNITLVSTQVRQNNSSTQVTATTVGFTPSASYQRATATTTISDATVNRVVERLTFSFSSGAAIDLTLRIAAPQLELGAFPTSYIPTTTAAATRAADVATVSPVSSFYSPTESTMLAEIEVRGPLPSARYVQFDDGTNNNRFVLGLTSGASVQNFTTVEGATSLSSSVAEAPTEIVAGTIYKMGAAFAADNAISARNGVLGLLDTTGAMPSGIVRFSLSGQPPSANTRQGLWLRKIAYWPKRLTDTLLQQLTT